MTTITAELITGTRVEISNGRHSWRADEPPDAGGQDTGPTPYELLMGALAACTCITLALYARHKKIALKSVSASYDFDRIHADDCADCEDEAKGFIERIQSRIRITGDFDAAQRTRLAQVATRCPVHKTLANGLKISDDVQFA